MESRGPLNADGATSACGSITKEEGAYNKVRDTERDIASDCSTTEDKAGSDIAVSLCNLSGKNSERVLEDRDFTGRKSEDDKPSCFSPARVKVENDISTQYTNPAVMKAAYQVTNETKSLEVKVEDDIHDGGTNPNATNSEVYIKVEPYFKDLQHAGYEAADPSNRFANIPKNSVSTDTFTEGVINKTDTLSENPGPSVCKSQITTNKFNCSSCTYGCRYKSTLIRHLRIHMGEKPFVCDACGFRCGQSSHLKSHMLTHTGEKPFHCDLCGYRCSKSSHLKTHMRIHTGEKRYACEFCDYRCSEATYLKRHMRTHTGDKRYHCNLCDYECCEACDLKRHKRTHTGEKRFHCESCDYACSGASEFKRHTRIHTGEKPFYCDLCEYKCGEASRLKDHMRVHTGEKPFQCGSCDYRCSLAGNLRRHVRIHMRKEPHLRDSYAKDVANLVT